MSERLQVALLGPVELRVDGDVVAVPSASQRTLLARLALSPGHVVPASELIDLLWPEDPSANAAGNLHSYVSRLRKLVGPDRLARRSGGYCLAVESGDVDTGRAERLVAEARQAAPSNPGGAAARLGEALGLWRGDALADVAGSVRFAPELARLSEWHAHLLADWLELRLAATGTSELLPELERAARAYPMRERMQLLLMRALHRDGRTAEALRVAGDYRRRLAEEHGLDPSPELADLQQRMLADDVALRAVPQRRASRPRRAPPDRFVGRGAELARLRAAAAAPGLVSVVGPGGVGKTRLVAELLDRLPEQETTYLVELGDVAAPEDVAAAVAATMGLHAAPDGVETAIADRLGPEPALLVLDNCEHVLDTARCVAAGLLARCPALRLVATSRQRLGAPGERVQRLGALELSEQVELFCDRASALRPEFDDAAQERGAVAEVCGLVDGLPLGVELAARREAVFGLPQLHQRLAAGLDAIEPSRGGGRSAGMTSMVEWSYRLLGPEAQVLFDRLAVCHGGFGLDALETLAPTGAGNPAAVLAELAEASMVVADLGADPPRYRLLETMRRVGLGHLDGAALDDAHGAHARWMQAHAETIHRCQGERSATATVLLRRESANLRGVLARLIDDGRWDQAGRLAVPLAVAVADDPHLDLLAQLGRLGGATPGGGGALCRLAAGAAAWLHGAAAEADELLTAALDQLADEHPNRWVGLLFRLWSRMYIGDATGVAADTTALQSIGAAPEWARGNAVCCAALIDLFTGDRPRAQQWMTGHTELLARIGEAYGFVAYTRGELEADEDPVSALAWFDQAYRRCDERGQTFDREVAGIGRAAVLVRLGRHADAVTACRDLISSLRQTGMWPQLWTVLRLTAELLVDLDDPVPAAILLTAADRDPLAPAVLGPDRERQARLWSRIDGAGPDPPAGGRAGAVAQALAALDRHG